MVKQTILTLCVVTVMILPAFTKVIEIRHKVEKRSPSKPMLFGDGKYYWHPIGWAPQRYDEEDPELGAEKDGGRLPALYTNNDVHGKTEGGRTKRNIVFPDGRAPVRPGRHHNSNGVIFPNRPSYPNFPTRPTTKPNVVPTPGRPAFPPRFPPVHPTKGTTAPNAKPDRNPNVDPGLLDDFPEGTTKKFRESVTPAGPREREHVTPEASIRERPGIGSRAGFSD